LPRQFVSANASPDPPVSHWISTRQWGQATSYEKAGW